ncbi:MAG: recombination-associated protein RdgC [Lentisphaeria bacterium]|nr:recombination-associated protein RdgC [Lentisphaeria bacterium]
MGFDRGNLTFRICLLPDTLPSNFLEKIAAECAGSLEHVTDEPSWGWVTGRFLLETEITEQNSKFGPYLHICLRQAERKVPASLLNAECKLEELSRMRANNKDRLSRKELKEIKEGIKERLLPQMPPSFSGTYAAIDPIAGVMYLTATSAKQLDIFSGFFSKAAGFDPLPMTPDNLAQVKYGVDPLDVPAVNISPELEEINGATGLLGENFLTWLWFFQESHNGIIPPTRLGDFSLMVDGPLTFVAEGGGAFESSLRKGNPVIAAEARSAMMVGKKLRSAKIILARNKGEEWVCTLDASQFIIRGLKLPDGEAMDPVDIFTERMANLDIFRQMLFELFHLYLNTVTDSAKLAEYQEQAKKWVQNHAQH